MFKSLKTFITFICFVFVLDSRIRCFPNITAKSYEKNCLQAYLVISCQLIQTVIRNKNALVSAIAYGLLKYHNMIAVFHYCVKNVEFMRYQLLFGLLFVLCYNLPRGGGRYQRDVFGASLNFFSNDFVTKLNAVLFSRIG